MDVQLSQLSAQAIQRKTFEKRCWKSRGGHVGERERVSVGDPEKLAGGGSGRY